MGKNIHEFRDPIHVFIRVNSNERDVVDSRPFQRLRYIHQLALTYLVYPGATHRRFEHSLGVMELASRVYDVITRPENIVDASVQEIMPRDQHLYQYWRIVLRMAALCHDLGHLPFSHAAEKALLPEGWTHERLTVEIIRHAELQETWKALKIQAEDVAKLAVGPKEYTDAPFTDWEAILSEIIVGNAFGVDRMDYLLRDSHHAGVAYGRFDHYRLVDTLRILPKTYSESKEPALGVEGGGLHSAEALILARYFMYTQLYFHPVRRIYDVHLKDFLKAFLGGGYFPTDVEEHLKSTDNEVTAGILQAARVAGSAGHDPASRMVTHNHYKLLYSRNPDDVEINPQAASLIYDSAREKFGDDAVRLDCYKEKGNQNDFPVLMNDGRIESSLLESQVLANVPIVAVDYVFVRPDAFDDARKWLAGNREDIIRAKEEE